MLCARISQTGRAGRIASRFSMRHWTLLGEAPIPGTDKSLSLFRGKDDFFIKLTGKLTGGQELMSSRKHGSEDALGALPCARIGSRAAAQVLIGGLGMGFTLAAALAAVGPDAEVTVAELIPEVVEWNRGPLGERSGRPLDDPRTRVYVGDVAKLLRRSPAGFDVIALDVDNGPEGLTVGSNDWLYSHQGIAAACRALRPCGVLAYWSAAPDRAFGEKLRQAGLQVEEVRVHAHGTKGARHTLWLAVDS
jgi:spermidine synthase